MTAKPYCYETARHEFDFEWRCPHCHETMTMAPMGPVHQCDGRTFTWGSIVERHQRLDGECFIGGGRILDPARVKLNPETEPEFERRTAPGKLEAVFIRAPIIRRVGPSARVLIRYRGDPVLVEEGRHLAATFHPELTSDPRVHSLFLEKL